MTDGVLQPLLKTLPVYGLSANITAVRPLPTSVGIYNSDAAKTGALSLFAPARQPSSTKSGVKARSFADDFFNKMYVNPQAVEFESSGASSVAAISLWNAYPRTVRLLSAALSSSAIGVTLDGPTTPLTLGPFETATYQVTLGDIGPATIQGTLSLSTDIPSVVAVPVTGTRVKLFPFSPNWSAPFRASYAFKTEIFTSRSGKEQRRALRQTARKSFEFDAVAHGPRLREFNARMETWQSRAFRLPEVTRWTDISETMPPYANSAALTSVPAWMVAGATVALTYQDRMEARTVQSVSGNTVLFSRTGAAPWPEGSRICPAVVGYLNNTISTTRITSSTATPKVRFSASPGLEADVDLGPISVTYGGTEVFLFRPNWAKEVSVDHTHDTDDLDYDWGRVQRYTPVQFGFRVTKATYVGRSAEEADAIVRFFLRMRGQQGEFYRPTGERDFEIKSSAAAGQLSLLVEGHDAVEFANSTVMRAVFLRLRDGRVAFNRISKMAPVNDDTLLTLASGWPFSFAPEDVSIFCWMPRSRFASDTITVDWLTSSVAQVQLPFRSLEEA